MASQARQIPGSFGTRTSAVERSSEASPRQRVETLRYENRRLRDEVAALKHELALVYGHKRAVGSASAECGSLE